ncbi:hypothetical protein JTE90_026147 [Oedothorax gibbosus]|uniref:Histone H2A n=1 Tax=Oedothorax gibbosus TaxID=931172 RepID=A0AAV6UZR8_9ARAC|nr:hypothetical protein JTE90_026147 [Oedothorax gibbosus]
MPPKKKQTKTSATIAVKNILAAIQTIDKNASINTAVYFSAALEYVMAEIIEKATIVATMRGSSEISPADITEAINTDSGLKDLLAKNMDQRTPEK